MRERKDDDKYFKQNIKGVGKIVICHNGSETITVGLPALQAHIKHGDEIGKCNGQTPPPPGDTTAPVISVISATSTASTTASVTWTTNESADSTVWYATSTPVSTTTASSTSSAALVTGHSIDLSELSASTLYYYFVVSKDSALNTATSTESSFTTLAP